MADLYGDRLRSQIATGYAGASATYGASRRAQEQWDWQKKLYGRQLAASKAGAGSLSTLVNQYNQAYGEARTANEQRYQSMLGITDRTTGQRSEDIRSEGFREQSNVMQQLARQGMAGTTIAPTMRAGIRRGTSEQLNRAADQLQGTKLGIMERRTDEYPRSDIIMQLAQALGQSGTGDLSGILKALSGMKLGGATS